MIVAYLAATAFAAVVAAACTVLKYAVRRLYKKLVCPKNGNAC